MGVDVKGSFLHFIMALHVVESESIQKIRAVSLTSPDFSGTGAMVHLQSTIVIISIFGKFTMNKVTLMLGMDNDDWNYCCEKL